MSYEGIQKQFAQLNEQQRREVFGGTTLPLGVYPELPKGPPMGPPPKPPSTPLVGYRPTYGGDNSNLPGNGPRENLETFGGSPPRPHGGVRVSSLFGVLGPSAALPAYNQPRDPGGSGRLHYQRPPPEPPAYMDPNIDIGGKPPRDPGAVWHAPPPPPEPPAHMDPGIAVGGIWDAPGTWLWNGEQRPPLEWFRLAYHPVPMLLAGLLGWWLWH